MTSTELVCSKPIRGTTLAATGTDAGWQRHNRAKDSPCEPCVTAHRLRVGVTQRAHPESHRAANGRWREANPTYMAGWRDANPEYYCWKSMVQRCTKPDAVSYPRYGGIGVTVCDRWIRSYEDFRADVGPRPSREHSLDRVDPYGHYVPGNVRWATRVQQRANRRRSSTS